MIPGCPRMSQVHPPSHFCSSKIWRRDCVRSSTSLVNIGTCSCWWLDVEKHIEKQWILALCWARRKLGDDAVDRWGPGCVNGCVNVPIFHERSCPLAQTLMTSMPERKHQLPDLWTSSKRTGYRGDRSFRFQSTWVLTNSVSRMHVHCLMGSSLQFI